MDGPLRKVVAFITRPAPAGGDLLVFDHPLAGVQLPAGTLEPGEDPLDGARREAWEETGLDQLKLVQQLGRGWFHFSAQVGTRPEWWVKTPDGGGLCWRCRWAPLSEVELVAGQQEWLDAVRDRLAGPPGPAPAAVDDEGAVQVFWAPPFGGRTTVLSWVPPDEEVVASRALGVCFTVEGRVVLVRGKGESHWLPPGGRCEPGESIEETMRREVDEEACARVLSSTLIGYERFVDVAGAGVDHGARFAARVALEPFVARYETEARTVVPIDEVPALMPGWQPDSLRWLLEAATAAGGPPVELRTARDGLVLRELTAADAEAFAALAERNRQHAALSGLNTRFGIWKDGDLIGRVDLNPLNPPNYVLGYWLDERATGHGYATDACRAALDFARSALRAEVMWAGVTHGNRRSAGVLHRLGFERVAELERHSRYRLVLSNRDAASR